MKNVRAVLDEAIIEYEYDRDVEETRQHIAALKADLADPHDPSCECRSWARWELQEARRCYMQLTKHDRQAFLEIE